MSTGQIIVLLAFAFSNSLTAFIFAARAKGWQRGRIFEEGHIPTYISIGCLGLLIGRLIAAIITEQIDMPWILLCVPAHIVGGMILMAVFRSWCGMVSIIALPLLSIGSVFFSL